MPFNAQGLILFAPPANQFHIPDPIPGGFQPTRIIYREFDSMTRPSRHYYYDIDKPTPCQPNVNIDAFVNNIAINGYRRNGPDAREEKPLDITVWFDSYIILELHKASALTFNQLNEAVTLSSQSAAPPNNVYGALKYVDALGGIHPAPIPNCRLVYFAAKHVAGTVGMPYTQGLNFNLVTIDGTITIIDPDVRHPGGSMP